MNPILYLEIPFAITRNTKARKKSPGSPVSIFTRPTPKPAGKRRKETMEKRSELKNCLKNALRAALRLPVPATQKKLGFQVASLALAGFHSGCFDQPNHPKTEV